MIIRLHLRWAPLQIPALPRLWHSFQMIYLLFIKFDCNLNGGAGGLVGIFQNVPFIDGIFDGDCDCSASKDPTPISASFKRRFR